MYPSVSLPDGSIRSDDIEAACIILWQRYFDRGVSKWRTNEKEHPARFSLYSGAILGRSHELVGESWTIDMPSFKFPGLFMRAPQVGSLHIRNIEGDYIGWGLGRNWDCENRDGEDRYVCFEDVAGSYIGTNIARRGATVDTTVFVGVDGEAVGAVAECNKDNPHIVGGDDDRAVGPTASRCESDFGMVEDNDTGVENAVFIRVSGDAIAEGIYARNTIFHDVATPAYPPRVSWPDATPVTAYIRADPSVDPDEGKPEAILYDGSTGIDVSPQAARTVRSLTDEEYQLIASLGGDNDAPPPDKDEVEDVTSRLAEGVDTDE